MSHYSSGSSGPPWPNIFNNTDNYNYIYGNGNMISNQNYVLNYLVRPEALPDAIAIITKALGQHHLPSAVLEAQPDYAACMPGTRVQFLERVLTLLTARTGPHIAWIAGMAGTGKTSIAHTLSLLLWVDTAVYLGGSFFCSRSTGTVERTDVQRIVPTLATTLARQFPAYALALAKQLAEHPDAPHWSVHSQVEHLLRLPFEELGPHNGQIVFVIDALDECSDQRKLAELIDALVDFRSVLLVKFLLTSRPEMYIRNTPINNPDLSSILQLHTVDPADVAADLRLYIGETLAGISGRLTWYTQQDVETLVYQSCGLFIFASTVVRYINNRINDEGRRERLRKVTEAVSRGPALTAALDQVYELVLSEASRPDVVDTDELEDTRRVLACILTARMGLSIQALADLMEVGPASLRGSLERLASLVHVPEGDIEPGIRTLHASFGDYIFERAASRIRIAAAFGHTTLARGCLRRMVQDDLCFNVSRSRSSFEPNPDDAPDRISLSLLYACLQWAHHLYAASNSSMFDAEVGQVFQMKFLFWLEVLSVMKRLNVASGLLRIAGSVVQLPEVALFLRDANSFVASSYEVIARSAPHIYLSALPFAAQDSLIYQYFGSRCTGVVSVETFGIDRHGGSLVMTLAGHEKIVDLVAYSRDGRFLASASRDHTVRVWDTRTGEEIMTPMRIGEHVQVWAVGFVPDNTCVAVCTSTGILRVQDIHTGRERLHCFYGDVSAIKCAAISSDGALVAAGFSDGTVRIVDTETEGNPIILEGDIRSVDEIAFSPDVQLVVVVSRRKTVCFWDCRSGQARWEPLSTADAIISLAISPDGKILAAGMDATGVIKVWDLESPARTPTVLQNKLFTPSLAFSPDGLHLTAACLNDIRSWNWRTKREVTLLHGHSDEVNSVAYSHDGRYIASASRDRTIRVWDAGGSRDVVQPLAEHTDVIFCVAVSASGATIVSGCDDGSVYVWDAQTGELKQGPLLGHKDTVLSLSISESSNGGLIASGSGFRGGPVPPSDDFMLRIWNLRTGEAIGQLLAGYTAVGAVAFSPDGSSLASVAVTQGSNSIPGHSTVHVWDLETRTPLILGTLSSESFRPSISFSPDGRLLAVGIREGLHIWQVQTGQILCAPLQVPRTFAPAVFVVFSRDSMRILTRTGGSDDEFRVCDIYNGQISSVYPADSAMASAEWVVCSTSGQFISRASAMAVYIWAEAACDALATVRGERNFVAFDTFTPDGNSIIFGERKTIRVWQIEGVGSLEDERRCDPIDQLAYADLQANESDGWVVGPSGELLLWVPSEYCQYVQAPFCTVLIGKYRVKITGDAAGLHYGENWTLCWRSDG